MSKKVHLCTRKQRLLDYLTNGERDYSKEWIDLEGVVYTKPSEKFDIEVSGGSYTRPFTVYVWALSGGKRIATHRKVQSEDIPAAAAAIEAIAQECEKGLIVCDDIC